MGRNTVELKTKAPDSVTFTTNGAHKVGGAADASVQAECKPVAGITVKAKVDTAGVTSTTLESEGHLVKGLKMTLAGATPPLDKAGLLASAACSLEYSADTVSALCSYDHLKGAAAASGVVSYAALKGGASVLYDVNKGALKLAQLKLALGKPGYAVVGSVKSDLKATPELGCSYHHDVGGDMQVAAEVGLVPGGKTSFAAGAVWALDKESTAKAKVDTAGMLGLSYKRKLSKVTTVVLAGCFDLNMDGSKTKTGVAITLAP